MKIKIIIIDDHTLLRETWMQLINLHKDYVVVGNYGTAREGLEGTRTLKPDLILLDINLPQMNGLEATLLFRKYFPGIKIIGISLHNQPAFAKQMIRNGALGYITKSSSMEEMFNAFQYVLAGKKYVCNEIKNIIAESVMQGEPSDSSTLSTREVEVIRYLKMGHSSREIAGMLYISVKTVEVHRYNILKKLNLKNTAALVDYINKHPSLYVDLN